MFSRGTSKYPEEEEDKKTQVLKQPTEGLELVRLTSLLGANFGLPLAIHQLSEACILSTHFI